MIAKSSIAHRAETNKLLCISQVLAKDLENSLFADGSEDRARIKIQTVRSKDLIITGGRWKNQVVEWLKARGF